MVDSVVVTIVGIGVGAIGRGYEVYRLEMFEYVRGGDGLLLGKQCLLVSN